MHNCSDLIGTPFADGGRDPKTGLDCWGLARIVLRRFGQEVPEFHIACHDALAIRAAFEEEREAPRWAKLDAPEPGCVIAFAIHPRHAGVVQHVGVYLGFGKFIHTLEKAEACLGSLEDDYWRRHAVGYYRWVG